MTTINLIKTVAVLFIIGVLMSFSAKSSSDVVTLTSRNHIAFVGPVNDMSVAKAQLELATISSNLSKSDVIYLVIDSPGGSIAAGNRFIDFANSLPQKIKPICLFCASMGYIMFQSFDERLVYASSELMSHRASLGGVQGQIPGEFITRVNNVMDILNRINSRVSARLGMSKEAYERLIYNELWLEGEAAVKMKHADKVVKITCERYLATKTEERTINTFFGPVTVKTSKCPLISGFLSVKMGAGSSFRSEQEAVQVVKKTLRTYQMEF